ncbi:MAG: type II toxin-antitoxin system VapC family toxin [Pseudomonadota bacterium]
MIAIDTSALVAILLQEPDAARFAQAIQDDEEPMLSAASLIELSRVMKHKQGPETKAIIDRLVEKAGITIASVTPLQAEIACAAGYRFPVLNFGDVFSYALAKDRDIDLLFKGDDFSRTDIGVVA